MEAPIIIAPMISSPLFNSIQVRSLASRAWISPVTPKCQRLASLAMVCHTIMECTPTRRPDVRLTTSVIMGARTRSCAEWEPFLINVFSIVIIGIPLIVANPANTTVLTPTWVSNSNV